METSTEPYAGMTFASSMRGWRYVFIGEQAGPCALLLAVVVSSFIRGDESPWLYAIYFIVAWTGMSWFTRNRSRRKVFRSRVTICEDGLDAVDAGEATHIPMGAILGIRIKRSPSGHRRKVEIRVYGGVVLTLLEPEQGELFEQWAREVAQPAGINLTVKLRSTMNAVPIFTFVLLLVMMLAMHAAVDRGWL